jgi:NAD-dependent dihydropyrimidine dehydrogenase PreA subunit
VGLVTKAKRQIISIDEERCDGCGLCVPSCAEGALQIVNGKVRLIKESYCDGLGACLGECPQGALTIIELEADAYDELQVLTHLQRAGASSASAGHAEELPVEPSAHAAPVAVDAIPMNTGGSFPACPGSQLAQWEADEEPAVAAERQRSQLRQWPVQLHLLPAQASFFEDAALVLVADCVPFAYANFHEDFLRGHAVAVGCPKLDDSRAYVDKLTQILLRSDIRSLKVAYMEVPCCRGLVQIAQQALANSGKQIPFETVMIAIAR